MRHAEWDLQVEVVKLLREAGCVYFHIPNERNGGIVDSRRMKAGGVVKGAPDLLVYEPNKKHHWLELKTPTGRRSIEQECMEDIAKRLGIDYRLVRSVDDIKDICHGKNV